VTHSLKGIIYNAKGRYQFRDHSGHYFFQPSGIFKEGRWQLGLS
jgi:hypothetical protein